MIVGILSPNCDFWFAEGLEGEADAEIEAFLAEAAVQEARGAGFGDLGALLAPFGIESLSVFKEQLRRDSEAQASRLKGNRWSCMGRGCLYSKSLSCDVFHVARTMRGRLKLLAVDRVQPPHRHHAHDDDNCEDRGRR